MSAPPPTDPVPAASSGPKKKNNNKKKKNANKPKELAPADGASAARENEDGSDEAESPTKVAFSDADTAAKNDTSTNGHTASLPSSNGHPVAPSGTSSSDATVKLEAMGEEREALKKEVKELRKRLEGIHEKHNEDLSQLKTELEDTRTARDTAETQYQNLLGRVEKIKETLSDRLKRDKEELEEAKERIEELETENEKLRISKSTLEDESAKLKEELQETTREATTLRSRTNLSQQNWSKEKEEMARKVAHLTAELESTTNAMGEWEVIAMEERSVKESLADKSTELEEQVVTLRQNYESATSERDHQSQTIDNLQKVLREIQEARKKELREMVETSEEQLQSLKKLVQDANSRATTAEAARESLSNELERMAPFEKEVKEKNLLIGKLRHEAIVLNDHLTKALRYLKKSKPEENVDRQVVTNHLIHFLTTDRSDPKRFQILQVMAGYLNWTDEQREQAGLARPGASAGSLRLPASPFHRTPSIASLNAEFLSEPTPTSASNKESLADLWAGFLERSVEEAAAAGGEGGSRRKDSVSSGATGTTNATGTRPDTRG